jgi:class 3 adenylate cyclase
MFGFINLVELFQLLNKDHVNIYYAFADMISKLITNIIISDHNEKENTLMNNMDLQSVQFSSYMVKHIKKYEKDNALITNNCNHLIELAKDRFLSRIPENKTILEQELLKKILPFDFDKEYIERNSNSNSNSKQFSFICILFTDIVNYTELAKKYDDKIIFQLLSSVYSLFDVIIKQYPHLQKIETIGDAYMVVGDIFKTENNHPIVIKEIILFALQLLREVKTVKTPDHIPLSIRIGINIGKVSIGILGNEIPRLCVVGNSVNMASRLQSTADVDSIQMSRHIYEQLETIQFDEPFEIIKKENIFLKNMGSVTTYNIYLTKHVHIDNMCNVTS